MQLYPKWTCNIVRFCFATLYILIMQERRIDTLNQICEDLGINLHKFFEYQDKESVTLSEDEKMLIDDYRRLEHEQAIRVKAYLDGLLDLQKSKKN